MKIIYTFFIVVSLFMITGCQTIENKSQTVIKKENEKLSKFLQQPESELRIVMGEPDNIIKSDQGTTFLIYAKKKYNIICERKFEIDQNKMIVGFTSKGCFWDQEATLSNPSFNSAPLTSQLSATLKFFLKYLFAMHGNSQLLI